jgi:hypothetical protein
MVFPETQMAPQEAVFRHDREVPAARLERALPGT